MFWLPFLNNRSSIQSFFKISAETSLLLLRKFLLVSMVTATLHDKRREVSVITMLTPTLTFSQRPGIVAHNCYIGRGPFLERPEPFWAHFGRHNSLCIFETASRDRGLCNYFNFYSLNNTWKHQLYGISGSEFYQWLFGSFRETRPLCGSARPQRECSTSCQTENCFSPNWP